MLSEKFVKIVFSVPLILGFNVLADFHFDINVKDCHFDTYRRLKPILEVMRLTILLSVLIVLRVESKSNVKIKKATARGFSDQMPSENVDGEVEFKETEIMVLQVEGYGIKEMVMKKRSVENRMQRRKLDRGNLEAAIYTDDDRTTTCRNECDLDTKICTVTCLQTEKEESCYVNKEQKALCFANDKDAEIRFFELPKLERRLSRTDRRKRSLEPDFDRTSIIKVAMFPDAAFMQLFMDFTDNTVKEAKQECKNYLTLVANEMNLNYQTIKDFGYKFNLSTESGQRPLDFSIYLTRVYFPRNNGTSFINYAWSENNLVNGYVYEDSKPTYNGILSDFGTWIGARNPSLNDFDHAFGLTGYDFFLLENGTKVLELYGLAWFGTLCSNVYKDISRTTSMTRINGFFSLVLSHELGHGVGMDHDNNKRCPKLKNVMTPGLFFPDSSTKDTYYKFSKCSVREMKNHFESISPSDFDHSCLSDSGYSEEDFLAQFCKGLVGSDELSVKKQCQKATRWAGSKQCEFDGFPIGAVKSCIADPTATNTSGEYSAFCTQKDIEQCLPMLISDGTPCQPDGVAPGIKMCFHGDCVSKFDVCTPKPEVCKRTCKSRKCCRKYRKINGNCCNGCRLNKRGIQCIPKHRF